MTPKRLFWHALAALAALALLYVGTPHAVALAATMGAFQTGILVIQALDLLGHVINGRKLKEMLPRLDQAEERGERIAALVETIPAHLAKIHGDLGDALEKMRVDLDDVLGGDDAQDVAGEVAALKQQMATLPGIVAGALRAELERIGREQAEAQEAALAEAQAAPKRMRGDLDPEELREEREEVNDSIAAAEEHIREFLTTRLGPVAGLAAFEWAASNKKTFRRACRALARGNVQTAQGILAPSIRRFSMNATTDSAASATSAVALPPMG